MRVGDIAPNFNLKDQNGNEFELYKNLEKNVLLVFYPKDDTPVCSNQLLDYNNNLKEFESKKITIVGINPDSMESHKQFCTILKLNFSLLSDTEKKVSKCYKALFFNSFSKRKLVLVNTERKVYWIREMLPVRYIKSEKILSELVQLEL